MKISVTGLNSYFKEWDLIWRLISDTTKGVKFPCMCENTGDKGDHNEPIVKLPNGKQISTYYLQIAD